MPGGPLKSSQQEVARLEAQGQDPGERYIVLLSNEQVNSRIMASAMDTATPSVIPVHIYQHAVKGFSAYLTPEAKRALEQDPRVASITPDAQFQAAAQKIPRGITRIGAHTNPVAWIDSQDQRVDVDIAIIDSGIDVDHPDLNGVFVADCTESPTVPGRDETGHGTHVAGAAAALDYDIGVAGIAPGARIWSFRVLDARNVATASAIISCVDLVAQYASEAVNGETIDVANGSISGIWPYHECGVGDPFHDAICGMIDAGVTTVVAAGNDSMDAANFNPANMDEVITVSALADSDGARLGLAGPYADPCTNPQADDSLATFSNYGASVDIAAPGVGILSTWPRYLFQPCVLVSGIGYDVLAGTSMASPHVAGAAGLLLARNPNLSPEQVQASLLASREQVALKGDPDGINEGVHYVGAADPKGPSVRIAGRTKAKVRKAVPLRITADDPSGVARVILYRCKLGVQGRASGC